MTLAQARRSLRLGCGDCYSTFAPFVKQLMRRLHGSAQHIGKINQTGMRRESLMQMLAQKKVELQESLKRETYEQAASLRDQIRSIEEQLTSARPRTRA